MKLFEKRPVAYFVEKSLGLATNGKLQLDMVTDGCGFIPERTTLIIDGTRRLTVDPTRGSVWTSDPDIEMWPTRLGDQEQEHRRDKLLRAGDSQGNYPLVIGDEIKIENLASTVPLGIGNTVVIGLEKAVFLNLGRKSVQLWPVVPRGANLDFETEVGRSILSEKKEGRVSIARTVD